MHVDRIRRLLESVKSGDLEVGSALDQLKELPFEDLGFANVDHHRSLRAGFPEVIYCEGKTAEQVAVIAGKIIEKGNNLLATRASREVFEKVREILPDADYYEQARIVAKKGGEINCPTHGFVAVVTAGTSDIPVAEEAAVTAEMMGNTVERIFDVGVAGLHRLLARRVQLSKAAVIIVVAGMEGALASVVGGLVDKPIIAVPTSIGYGASFNGLAALLTMLNSCASGVTVVNIDNGFGAGYAATLINRLGND